jgi:DNA-directed RNA polymerase specialized sigma24 family protein
MTHLPTRAELETLIGERRARLVGLAGSIGNCRDQAWREDVVQSVILEVLLKIDAGVPFVDTTLWQFLCWTLRNRVIDRQRRKELKLLQDFAGAQDDASVDLAARIPATEPTPAAAALGSERLERKKKLLSDILEEYCRHCESQPRMTPGKEIFERMLRGESAEETAAAMGMKRNTIDKARRDARLRLRELMTRRDVHQSVFQTFYRREMDHPFQGRRQNSGVLATPASELFRWIMDEAGALCPAEARLKEYLADPQSDLLHDVHYHVEEAGCPLCRNLIQAWSEDGEGG